MVKRHRRFEKLFGANVDAYAAFLDALTQLLKYPHLLLMNLRRLAHFPSSLAWWCAAFKNMALAPHVVFSVSLRRPAGGKDFQVFLPTGDSDLASKSNPGRAGPFLDDPSTGDALLP